MLLHCDIVPGELPDTRTDLERSVAGLVPKLRAKVRDFRG